jgi:hypothetical protein
VPESFQMKVCSAYLLGCESDERYRIYRMESGKLKVTWDPCYI